MASKTDARQDLKRSELLIKNATKKFNLDLSGYTVLTQAASGYYALTQIIAAVRPFRLLFAVGQHGINKLEKASLFNIYPLKWSQNFKYTLII